MKQVLFFLENEIYDKNVCVRNGESYSAAQELCTRFSDSVSCKIFDMFLMKNILQTICILYY